MVLSVYVSLFLMFLSLTSLYFCVVFFFNDTPTTEIYTYDTLFPYTTLFRSGVRVVLLYDARRARLLDRVLQHVALHVLRRVLLREDEVDRKSTRLNSSH